LPDNIPLVIKKIKEAIDKKTELGRDRTTLQKFCVPNMNMDLPN
jgi:hypothetical protein